MLLTWGQAGGLNAGAQFASDLITTLVARSSGGSSTPTFTRATTAYQTDFEGKLNLVLSGEARNYGPFDWIFEHTCFCAIRPDRRADYVGEAAAALKTGGFLLAVFFMDPENSDPNSPPFASSSTELDGLFLPAFQKIDFQTDIPTYAGREQLEHLVVFQKR